MLTIVRAARVCKQHKLKLGSTILVYIFWTDVYQQMDNSKEYAGYTGKTETRSQAHEHHTLGLLLHLVI